MRVLHVVPVLASAYGGPATHVVESALAGAAHGIEGSVVATNLAGPPSRRPRLISGDDELPAGAKEIEVSLCPASWPYRFAYSRDLPSVLREEIGRANLVRIHSLFLFPQYAAFREARRAGVPYIVSFHGALDPYLRKRGRARKWLTDRTWQRDMLRHATAIHVTSTDEQTLTADVAREVPRILVPNGIDWKQFQALPDAARFRATRLDGHEGPIVLSLGRIARKKAPDRLVRALPGVLAAHPTAMLVFAGPDDERLGDRLRALARSLRVEPHVRFVGMLHGDERLEALSAADVWALPSHTENFAVAAAEAMAAGLPVVLTPQVNIAADAAAAGAAIVTRADAADLAAQLVRLLGDARLRQRLGERAREHAKQYDWGRIGAELARIYRDVLGMSEARRVAA